MYRGCTTHKRKVKCNGVEHPGQDAVHRHVLSHRNSVLSARSDHKSNTGGYYAGQLSAISVHRLVYVLTSPLMQWVRALRSSCIGVYRSLIPV